LAIDDAARWYAALQGRDGTGARALQLLVLTATRSQEVRGAAWDEFDLDKGLWVIPAQRMKMDREHRVALSAAAVALLQSLPRHDSNPLVFPSARGGQVSDMTLSATMKRMHETEVAADRAGFVDRVSKRPAVPHGLRSTFRDWVAERTQYPGDMAEVALAHRISNAVEASYRRGDMIEKRRAMMAAWAGFLGQQEPAGKVVRLQK
jgi:integrase